MSLLATGVPAPFAQANRPMKRAHHLLLAILLCSCTAPTGASEGGEAADWGRLPFWVRSNPLVEHTFQIMETRAQRSEMRELQRDRGLRVCEEGENGTNWKEDCKRCRCEWGVRSCTVKRCMPPEESARLRAEARKAAREKAERYREVREMDRARGVRVCEEGEHGTRWHEGGDTCWCERGIRYCTEPGGLRLAPPPHWPGPPPPPDPEEKFTVEPAPDTLERSRSRCKEDEIGTTWRWGCNTCWCADGFRVCSRADCPAAP
jgi:hypothetical protein